MEVFQPLRLWGEVATGKFAYFFSPECNKELKQLRG